MPRIRAVKPEFFRSPDVAAVEPLCRLFYQALWCWADDFGVGETNINGLLGFAFPDDDQIYDSELRTFRAVSAQDVRTFCADCAHHFSVTFYIVRGRHYYQVQNWQQHQRFEKREARRQYPPPDDPDAVPDLQFQESAQCGAKSAQKVRKTRAGTGEQGTGEQGNRGTGEEQTRATALRTPATPQDFDAFWATYPRRRDKRKAEKAYSAALKRADPDTILEGARRYAEDPNREDRYTKYPEGWLNGDGWLDEPLPARNGHAVTKVDWENL